METVTCAQCGLSFAVETKHSEVTYYCSPRCRRMAKQ